MVLKNDCIMVAVDWGSSKLRIAALGEHGRIIAVKHSNLGIKHVLAGEHGRVLIDTINDWTDLPDVPWVLCGMVGSRSGWLDVPYQQAPTGCSELSASMFSLEYNGRNMYFVPGVVAVGHQRKDVMRGEETQVVGCSDEIDRRIVVLPGTHSKWVSVDGEGRIAGFRTFITGDMYEALLKQTVLGMKTQPSNQDEEYRNSSFIEGVFDGFDCEALTNCLFNVRVRSIFDEQKKYNSAAYLSGLLIGYEYKCGTAAFFSNPTGLLLVGALDLTKFYLLAAEKLGINAKLVSEESTFKGCYRLARQRGLVR